MSAARPPRSARIAIVVPCHDEAERLPVEVFERFAGRSPHIRFLLVDDGSRDGTGELLRGMERDRPESFRALELRPNRGKAEAVRAGMLEAMEGPAELVGFWDADLATPLELIDRLAAVMDEAPEREIVIGSRVRLLGRSIERTALRHVVGRSFATLASLTLALPVYDTQCGAKLFRNDARMRALFAEPFLSRWIFDVELIARYGAAVGWDSDVLAAAIYEHPIETWSDVGGSKVKPADLPRSLVGLARILLRYRLGPRP